MQRALRRTALFLVFPALAWAGYRLGQDRPRDGTEPLASPTLKADVPTLLGGKADTSQQRKSLAIWLGTSGEASWEELARALAKLPNGEQWTKLGDLARWNPSAAMDLAEALAKISKVRGTLAYMVKLCVESDAEAAGKRFRALDEAEKSELLPGLFSAFANTDSHGIGDFMAVTHPKDWPAEHRNNAAETWAAKDPTAAAAWIAALPIDQQQPQAKAALDSFAKSRGGLETFMKAFGHLNWGEGNPLHLKESLSGIRNPEEALTFGKSIPNAHARALYLSTVMDQIGFEDTHEVMRRFDADIPDEDKKAVAGRIGSSLHDHFSEVWAWMRERPEFFGVEAARGLFDKQAEMDQVGPEHLAAFEEIFKRTPPEQRSGLSNEVYLWSAFRRVTHPGDEDAIIAWIDSLQDSNARNSARAHLAEHLGSFDPAAASEQVALLPPGQVRDGAVSRLIPSLADDPERAFLWAATVDDPRTRVALARQVLRNFGGTPAESVTQVIKASTLPLAEKQELLQEFTP